MRRALAVLLVPALMTTLATSAAVALLHTHDYDEHDHPEHQHGLAAHEHHRAVADDDDGTPHLEGCDPGAHTVSLVFVCAVPPHPHGLDADVGAPGSLTPQVANGLRTQPTDTRVHGPPLPALTSPRAPPAILHA